MHRRDFLKASTCLAVSSTCLMVPEPAEAFWPALLAAAAAVAALVAAFSKHGDGGLGAYLASIRNLQLIELDQLQRIEVSIFDLNTKIAALPNVIEGLLDDQSITRLDGTLRGTASALSSVLKVRLAPRASAAGKSSEKDYERNLRDRIVEGRQTLQATPRIGNCPHAALIAAYVLPVELTYRYFVGEDHVSISAALDEYEEWRQAFLDETSPFSVTSYVNEWADKAATLFDTASKLNDMAKAVLSSPPAQWTQCYSYLDYTPAISPVYRPGKCHGGDFCSGDHSTPGKPEVIGHSSHLFADYFSAINEQYGFKEIDLTTGKEREYVDWESTPRSNPVGAASAADNSPPAAKVVRPAFISQQDLQAMCQELRLPPTSSDVRFSQIRTSSLFGYSDVAAQYQALSQAVDDVNDARAKVAFGVNASTIALSLRDAIEDARAKYGS